MPRFLRIRPATRIRPGRPPAPPPRRPARRGARAAARTLLAVVGLLAAGPRAGHAQGATRDAATLLTRPEFGGVVSPQDSDEQFYRVEAGPGEVTVTLDVASRRGATRAAVDLYDAAWTPLLNVYRVVDHEGTSERGVITLRLTRAQPVFLRLSRRVYGPTSAGSFHVRVAGAVAFAAAAPPAARTQTTITFAGNTCTGDPGLKRYRTPFDTQGFRFAISSSSEMFGTWCSDSPAYPGTTALFNDKGVGDGTTILTQLSGTPFSITSIDLAQFSEGPAPAEMATFVGTLVGGATVTQTFTIPAQVSGRPTLATYTFLPTFANLTSLRLADMKHPYQFTNLRLNQPAALTTPEPATSALLGAGQPAVGRARARRTVRA